MERLSLTQGRGAWLEHLDELPEPPVSLGCMHPFCDHYAGAARAFAVTNVDRFSVWTLIHSVTALDISLDWE